jgi:hypothetical protein
MAVVISHQICAKLKRDVSIYAVMFKLDRAGDNHMIETTALARASGNTPEGLSGFEPLHLWHATGFAGGILT